MDKTDCQVCKQLIKEKHRNQIWWKLACLIFAALSVVLGILYFGSGAVITETDITIRESKITNDGDSGVILIGGSDNQINGTIEETDYTPIICITIIASAAILVAGAVIIVNSNKNKEN